MIILVLLSFTSYAYTIEYSSGWNLASLPQDGISLSDISGDAIYQMEND